MTEGTTTARSLPDAPEAVPPGLSHLEQMLLIRRFEEAVVRATEQGKVRGPTHVYLGEEAVAVGVCAALRRTDYIVSTHRGHGHLIAKGGDPFRMFAELFGRDDGYCRGKGGSMHIADFSLGILGSTGIVGAGLPLAVGVGLTLSVKDEEKVVACFFGDGASNTGSFHEALNLAAVWRLPIVFVLENNLYAVTTPLADACRLDRLATRARAYGIPGISVEGSDVERVHRAALGAVGRARRGGGPTLLECRTYRWEGHYIGDPQVYRDQREVAYHKRKRDPVAIFAGRLKKRKVLSKEALDALRQSTAAAVRRAEERALASPEPPLSRLGEDLFAPAFVPAEPAPEPGTRELSFREAINEALAEELEGDPDVVVFGEDVGLHGGPFQVTKGLFKRFGPARVRNTPVSEAAIAGAAVGAAATGLRPVAEIMYFDFTTIASDQIVNQGAKLRYMFGGRASAPLVIRTQCGLGLGGAAHHSQAFESFYCHIPGLKVVAPSTPYDAKGLLKSAIREDNPVLFIEYKRLYGETGPVPARPYYLPLGSGDIKRHGRDLTIIATSAMVGVALSACEHLAARGVEAEVVDPRTLVPLDLELIVESVRRTHRALVVHDAVRRCGIGAEWAALIAEHAFDYLDAPVTRLGGAETPVPYAPNLERAFMPSEERIVEEALRLTYRGE